jgi:hypothetical protein
VRARHAAVLGDLDGARRHFAEACRLLLAEGDRDEAALVSVTWAEAEASSGSPESARRILDEALATLDQAVVINAGYFAEALRARLDAGAGRPDAARRRLAGLGEDAAHSPSLSRRLAFLRARARLAAAEGRPEAARADLEAAVAAARRAQRKLDELELRLDLAAVAADPATAARLGSEVEREASRLGLGGLTERAGAAAREARTGANSAAAPERLVSITAAKPSLRKDEPIVRSAVPELSALAHPASLAARRSKPRPRARPLRAALPVPGEGGRDAQLHGPGLRERRGRARSLAAHGQARLELRPRLAARRAGRGAMSEG